MTSPPKTSQGPAFHTFNVFLAWINDGNWVYWRGRPKHPNVMRALSLNTLLREVEGRQVYRCYRFGTAVRDVGEPYRSRRGGA